MGILKSPPVCPVESKHQELLMWRTCINLLAQSPHFTYEAQSEHVAFLKMCMCVLLFF